MPNIGTAFATSVVSKRDDATNYVLDAGHDTLVSLPEHKRRRLVHALSRLLPDENHEQLSEPLQALAILLETKPYPSSVQANDQKVAARFYELWSEDQEHGGGNDVDTRRTFIRNCRLAMRATGLEMSKLNLSFRKVAFSRSNTQHEKSLKNNFEGMAAISHDFDAPDLRFSLRMNKNSDFWDKPSQGLMEKVENAKAALHEITHVQQAVKMRDIRGADDLYVDMRFYYRILQKHLGQYDIYRQTPHERQSYYRQDCFRSLYIGQDIEPESQSREKEKREKISMQTMADHLIGSLRKGLSLEA